MKKISLLLVFSLLILLLSACSSGAVQWGPIELSRRDEASDTPVQGDLVVVAVSVAAPLGGLELACRVTGEDGEITVAIYKAEKDYKTTLSGTPEREQRITNLTEKLLWQFRTLPAGDYLIAFSGAKSVSLLKSVVPSDEANGKILHYCNGDIMTDGTCALTLLCIKTNDVPEPGLVTFSYPVIQE